MIKENIRSKDTRFLLLASEKSMFGFLIDMIKEEIENYVAYIGSPFKGDRINASYQREMIGNIEKSVEKGKVIILSDLDQIYSTFYDLFNQNYIIKDGKKYCRISHGGNVQKLAPVNENTKFIVLVDKNNLRKQKLPFLSRFEKHIISFDNILNEKDKEKSETINDILKKLVTVKDINYNFKSSIIRKKGSKKGKDTLEISNIKYDEDGNPINEGDNNNDNNDDDNESSIIDVKDVKSKKSKKNTKDKKITKEKNKGKSKGRKNKKSSKNSQSSSFIDDSEEYY